MTPLRILHLEDNATDSTLLGHLLKLDGLQCDIVRVETEAGYHAALSEGSVDIIIADHRLPTYDGPRALKFARETCPDIPFIFFSGTMGEDTAVDSLKQGAIDYVLKHRPERLPAAVRRALHEREETALRKSAEAGQARAQEMLLQTNRLLQNAMADLKRTQQEIIKQERRNALTQMVSGIVHDFNNTLMPLVGLPEYLLGQPGALDDREELVRMLEVMRTAASDARDVVRRLREFYRPKEDMVVAPIVLADLIRDVVAMTEPAWKIQAQSEGRTITLETEFNELPRISGHDASLREMLTNLVINAAHAIPNTGVIRITTAMQGKFAVIQVSDNGVGMTERVKRRCFEPFFSTKGDGGTGLGLSLSYGIVERHGGRIDLDSEVGKGTTFTIHLPIRGPMERPVTAQSSPPRKTAISRKLNVLLADDSSTTRFMVAAYLTGDGHAITTVENGARCIEVLGTTAFDILLLDRAMPGMSGDEVAIQARQIAPGMPIIMLTGFGDLMNYRAERPDGVDSVLTKPVTPEELRTAMAAALQATEPTSP